MRHPRGRRVLVTLLERVQDTVAGEPVENFADAGDVWATITGVSETQRAALGRVEHPVERMVTLAPHRSVQAGNRIARGSTLYDIEAVDDTNPDEWHLGVSKVIRA